MTSDEYINNLLSSLANAQDYHCYIFSYERGHHQLTLAVHDPDSDSPEPSFYLHFEPTYYFEGPTGWTGADFRLATKNEWEEVLFKLSLKVSGDLKDEFVKRHFLFILEKPTCHIKILSALCHKVTEALYVSVSYATSQSCDSVSKLHGILKPDVGLPTDEELSDSYTNHLIEKYK